MIDTDVTGALIVDEAWLMLSAGQYDRPAGPPTEVEALRHALDMIAMTSAEIPPAEEHGFEFETDGDGWNEPETDHYSCTCGRWSLRWVQADRDRTGRTNPSDAALAWARHIEIAFQEEGAARA